MVTVMEVLDRHVQLATWAEHPSAAGFWENFLGHQDDPHLDVTDKNVQISDIAEAYAESVAHMMGLAETYYVSEDLCAVIDEAAETIPREPLRPHMVPARTGWIHYDQDMILGVNEHDEPWGICGISWRVQDNAGSDDFMDRGIKWFDQDKKEHLGPGITLVYWRKIEHLNVGEKFVAGLPWAAPGQLTGWAFDIPWDPDGRSNYTLDEVGERQRKIVLTTFNMLMDEIVVVRSERPNRGAVRRAAKALKYPEYGDVNVIDLRKRHVINYDPPDPDDDAEPVHWTHRWIVRPHWRTLHKGTNKEKHVWIRKHIKGPENRPLVVKDRLSRLIR